MTPDIHQRVAKRLYSQFLTEEQFAAILAKEYKPIVDALKAALKFQVSNSGTEYEFYTCYTMGEKMPKWVTKARTELSKKGLL